MYRKVSEAFVKKQPINYDYLYNSEDHSRLSCVEVLQEAYELAVGEKIPALPSKIEIQNPRFLKSIGARNGAFFVPGDLETDSRFELQWEWTDFKQTVDERMKDVIVQKLFQWISSENYQLQSNLKSISTKLLLSFRRQPAVWNLLSAKMGTKDIPLEIPSQILTTMVKTNDVGRILMAEIEENEKEIYQSAGRHLTEFEMEVLLEKFRAEDRETFLAGWPAPLHLLFRPWELKPDQTN